MLLFVATLLAASQATAQDRQVYAWATSGAARAAADQWTNSTWAGVFDGVQASCGVAFEPNSSRLAVNESIFQECRPLLEAVHATGGQFHVWIGAVPTNASGHALGVEDAIASARAIADELGIDGFSMDDETDCAPRSTLGRFADWMGFVDAFADGLHAHAPRLHLSAAVQAMFGIEDVAYEPACEPPELPECSQACSKAPWEYAPDARVAALMANSSLDRWLEMDTYYFGTSRFVDALDWYARAVPVDQLGAAVMNRDDISQDGYVARFHALDRSGANWLNIFLLPAADAWLPWVRRWKTRCAACPNAGALSCYEPGLDC